MPVRQRRLTRAEQALQLLKRQLASGRVTSGAAGNAAGALRDVNVRQAENPGRAPGGTGSTGLSPTDESGYIDMLNENAAAAGISNILSGKQPQTAVGGGRPGRKSTMPLRDPSQEGREANARARSLADRNLARAAAVEELKQMQQGTAAGASALRDLPFEKGLERGTRRAERGRRAEELSLDAAEAAIAEPGLQREFQSSESALGREHEAREAGLAREFTEREGQRTREAALEEARQRAGLLDPRAAAEALSALHEQAGIDAATSNRIVQSIVNRMGSTVPRSSVRDEPLNLPGAELTPEMLEALGGADDITDEDLIELLDLLNSGR